MISKPVQRGPVQPVFIEKCIKAAAVPDVRELRAGDVEWYRAGVCRDAMYRVC